MKHFYALVLFLAVIFSGYAQVGVGTPMPDSSAQLDVVAKDKGVLIPRIALKGIKDVTTIANGNVESLLVFNTSGSADLKPGYYYWHIDSWHRVVSSGDLTGGDIPDNIVVYNPVTNQFTYIDENGNAQEINFEEIVKSNETVTTLVNNENGTYTYTSENGTITTINVPADVINQFEEIIQNENVVNEITELIQNIGGNVYYDGDQFTYLDENGETQTINFEELVQANETVTTLINNENGTYTYTSENGTITTINVPADVINQFEEIIQNENVVNEITELIQNVGGNVYYDGDQFTYLDENGDTQTINFEELVQANETVTTLVNNENGTYTYTSEDGTITTINVPADVINQFEEIIQNENVVNEITELIQNVGGNVYYDGDQFTYLDENGDTQTINFEELVQANETVTTLVNNENGTYTYTSENGTITTINVPADVINQFEEIIQNENVVNEITELIQNVGGNVYYDGDQFTYLDENGETQTINFEELVQANETITLLADNQDGTFTYTNEAGEPVTFDANTTTMADNGDGTYTFTNANGDTITVDVPNSVVENITNEGDIFNAIENLIKNIGGNVYYDGDQFTYLDENGETQTINFEELVQANETVTTLVNNENGTYTYTSEDGTITTINVPADVINQFEEIIQNENVVNEITELIQNVGGNVYYDGDQFTYLDENGDTQTINFEELVQANETVTTLVNNENGTYTYTSEDGTITTINVPADVINQFEEIIQNENVVNEITELIQNVGGNVYYDGDQFTYLDENGETQTINFEELVQANETITTLVNNENGTYTYTSEDGTITTINVPADVINQFEEIIQNENVVNEITELIQNVGGNVYYDGDQFTYLDENGETQTINFEELVQANETITTLVNNENGTYTYTSEDGTITTINVPADVINQFEEIIQNENVVNEITELIQNVGGNVYYDGDQFTYLDENGETQTINFEELVQANETITTLVNNENGTYTYTSEDGTITTINVPADVINQFEEIIQNENVVNEITELIQNVGGNVYYDGDQFTYLDENGETQTINFEELVQANETITLLADNQDGTFTYTNEAGEPVTFDANTTTMTDNGDGTYTFTNANGDTITVDVPNSVVENITNEGDIFNAIENLIKNIGGNVYYDGDQFTYLDENGETQTINFEELVQANETITTLVNNENGTYTYTSEDGTITTINVPADVINQFEEIIQNENVVNEITELIQNVGGNVYYDGDQFTYLDENGETQTINFEELVQANETITLLADNQDGTFTYTNEAGEPVTFDANTTTMTDNGDGTYTFTNANGDTITVDVPNSVVENITNEGDIFNAIENLIKNIGGNVYYDGDQFTYLDENGETQTINFEELVQANETVTTLVNNENGTYTYTSENGTITTINVPADVINQFEEIIQNENVVNEITELIQNVGGNVYYDGDQFTYLDENGETQTINFEELVQANETITLLADNQDGTFTYTNEAGEPVTFDANTTTMTDNGDGTYTFTNANGDTITVDVPNSVVENITNEGDIFNAIENLIKNIGGNVYYDGDQFTYLDENGETQIINFEELVQANETITLLADNQDGTFTYTNEAGEPVTFDANTTTMTDNGDGTYTFTNANGDTITVDVPNSVVENITNEGDIFNAIENLIKNIGGNVYYDGDQFTYLDENGETQTINFEELVQANETITTLVNNENGTYTYTSEDGTITTINVPADVINQFEEIIQNENVVNEITELIQNVGGNVYYDGDQFTYLDENGDTQIINFEELVQANETITLLADNQDGTFTYTNEAGEPVTFDANTTTMADNGDGTYTFTNANGDTITVDVPNSVVENITNEGDIFNAIENLIKNIGGNVYYDGDQFTYLDENGETQTINFEELVQANETITTLVNNENGTYTYTSENGTITTINVPADVINQFEEIIQNENVVNEITELIQNVGGNVYYDGDQFTYLDENGETQTINFEELVQANETITTLVNNENGTYTYTSEDGTITTINVPADVINQFEEIIQNENVVNEITELIQNVGGNVYYDGDQFTYLDENGETQTINFEELVQANETITTLVNNENGTYTYTSEDGTITTINVPADVINQFEEIIQNENVVNEITELIQNVGGNVYYDGDQFTYLDENGETQTINFEELVQANETVTTLVNNENGTYTYTSEDGTITTINVPADVINQFEEIIQNENVVNEITELIQNIGGNVYYDGDQFTYLDENGETQTINIEELVQANETVTTLVNNENGTYTYTSEDGTITTINVPADVINQFEEIIQNENVVNEITELIQNVGGNVYYDGDQFTYLDENGETQTINFEELVQANETLTILEAGDNASLNYTDEDGEITAIKAVMPKFFYMPSVAVPTEIRSTPQTLDLYGMYNNQFGSPMAKNPASGAATLPVLPAGELNYYITYFDADVFESVSVSDTGILTYTVKADAEISLASFMNIVFEVK